jgi:DNA-binding transcriptional LysR family regulator
MLKISLDALLAVDTIARKGSFSAAAKELFRVPSTISYTVAKLEEDLGVAIGIDSMLSPLGLMPDVAAFYLVAVSRLCLS